MDDVDGVIWCVYPRNCMATSECNKKYEALQPPVLTLSLTLFSECHKKYEALEVNLNPTLTAQPQP